MAVDSLQALGTLRLPLAMTRLEAAATWMRKALQAETGEKGGDT